MNTVGEKNPYRYRGYRYDAETGLYYLNSRYYDPEVGRFINADIITDGAAKTLGNNLFLYAANNPINNLDPSGNSIIKTAIKLFASLVVKPTVKKFQDVLATHTGTYSRGFAINISAGVVSINYQLGVSIDNKGNVIWQTTSGKGVTSSMAPGISFQEYQMITNAPSLDNLNGSGRNIGASGVFPIYDVPVYVGGDFNIIPDQKERKKYIGLTGGFGFSTPGFELHDGISDTVPIEGKGFNIFDRFDEFYIKIMEW